MVTISFGAQKEPQQLPKAIVAALLFSAHNLSWFYSLIYNILQSPSHDKEKYIGDGSFCPFLLNSSGHMHYLARQFNFSLQPGTPALPCGQHQPLHNDRKRDGPPNGLDRPV